MAYGNRASRRNFLLYLSSFEPPIPKNFNSPPKVSISFLPATRFNNFLKAGIAYTSLINEDFWKVGSTLFLYIFSIISGTDKTRVGFTFFKAGNNTWGVGAFLR